MRMVKVLFVSMCVFLLPLLPVLAQEPPDRPFPASAITATAEPTDRPFPVAQATATDRPFPAAATPTIELTASADMQPADAESTPELLLADVQATANAAQAQIAQLETERDTLVADLEAARTDNGATTFALVIIAIGVLLAAAVFFGLRRSGE